VGADTGAPEPVASPVAVARPEAVAAVVAAEIVAPERVDPPVVVASTAVDAAQTAHRMNIEDVEGIGPAYAEKLAVIGIKTTDDLLTNGARTHDRERIAGATGISGKLIRDWVNKADLMRIPSVGTQYSDLLEAAGVDSPAELAQRNPSNLAITIQEVVAARPGIVRRVPTEAEIATWIKEAGNLAKVVEH